MNAIGGTISPSSSIMRTSSSNIRVDLWPTPTGTTRCV